LRPVYTAVNADAAQDALLELAESELGRRHKAAIAVWERAWERFVPFLEFPPDLRKVIYTTNTIESLNFQLRKIIKNRGHFPTDDAVVKLLWLAICDIEDKRARAREADRGKPASQRSAPARLIEGSDHGLEAGPGRSRRVLRRPQPRQDRLVSPYRTVTQTA
jgi:putative transposase